MENNSSDSDTFTQLGSWPGILNHLMQGKSFDQHQAACILTNVLKGEATPAQVASFVTALRFKGETVQEMSGFVKAMLDFSEPVETIFDPIDTCGTGGDRTSSINISTIAAFVATGAGAKVCKHGGRAASSASGSADVLEALGVVIDLDPVQVSKCLDQVGMAFCFAPRFHPAMRYAAPVRKELGIATIFNFLGPLANPARTKRQVVGVSDASMAEKMLGVLQSNGATRAIVVHGDDGLDEVTITTTSTIWNYKLEPDGPKVEFIKLDPQDFGFKLGTLQDLKGGSASLNASLALEILQGATGPKRDVVVLNAAAALIVADIASDFEQGVKLAQNSIDSGKALSCLKSLVQVSNSLSNK